MLLTDWSMWPRSRLETDKPQTMRANHLSLCQNKDKKVYTLRFLGWCFCSPYRDRGPADHMETRWRFWTQPFHASTWASPNQIAASQLVASESMHGEGLFHNTADLWMEKEEIRSVVYQYDEKPTALMCESGVTQPLVVSSGSAWPSLWCADHLWNVWNDM